jgi:hypothetical protein
VIYFLLAWTAWACPGGWFAGIWPAPVRPLVCAPSARFELYDPARAAAARRRVSELGPSAALYVCRGLRCRGPISSWSQDVHFQEVSP